jgi:hypothetical protein
MTPDAIARLPYTPPLGLPLYWRDEQEPRVVSPHVWAYLEGRATPEDCAIVRAWIGYYVAAPCWVRPTPGLSQPDGREWGAEHLAQIEALRRRVTQTPATPEAIRDLIWACLELGLDPL